MFLLILVAFLAGIVTILAPCILPILPVVLSAGATGGRRRPLGIVSGLIVSFTFFTLSISFLVKHLGLGPTFLRDAAITILLIFGVILLVPKLLASLEVWLSLHLPKGRSGSERTDFWGGVLIGISLGLVWTPCVGPIIASVITLAATSAVTFASVLITLAYAIGTSIPLLIVMYGGKRLLSRIRGITKYSGRIQQAFGGIMFITAILMLAGVDQTIQSALLAKLPSSISSGITEQLEESGAVQAQIKSLKGNPQDIPAATQIVGGSSSGLPVLGTAPNFVGISNWLNSSPLTISQLKGKVVLVDFWTYSCINCLRSLPHVTTWYDAYKAQGFVVVGVHSPEFPFEKVTANVAQAITENGIKYPVAQDNDLSTWNAYTNEYWPAEYLIDAQGRIRATNFGEGDYGTMESNIRSLLKEAKQGVALPSGTPKIADMTPTEVQSPETYLGTDRQSGYVKGVDPAALEENSWTLSGNWLANGQYLTTGESGDSLSYRFVGNDAYLVLNPPAGSSASVQVLLDGVAVTDASTDAKNGTITVGEDRLYHLAHTTDGKSHLLTLIFQKAGVNAFSFTFG